MLKLTNIKKDYVVTQDSVVQALKGITLNFRKNEFVAVLGHSGCGKTTLLNIIGGLDRYTSGDLSINGVSTSRFTDSDWDTYRNHYIGFVFQNYNLISHQTVLTNVELALTLSGVGKAERRKRAEEALKEVGLGDHINKLPNQLSGGEMQRVAIARALINNPDILLADEPTGALDTATGVQIMEIIKKVSEKRLVIMVSHNSALSEQYATRIVKITDGVIVEDSMPYDGNGEVVVEDEIKVLGKGKHKALAKARKKTSMGWFTAFQLSIKNLLTKKGRSIITAIAGSIGIIGVGLVLSVQYGMGNFMSDLSMEVLNKTPLSITTYTFTDVDAFQNKMSEDLGLKQYPSGDIVYPYKPIDMSSFTVSSEITPEYVNYLSKMDSSLYSDMLKRYQFKWNLVTQHYYEYSPNPIVYEFTTSTSLGWSKMPSEMRASSMYELIGTNSKYPTEKNELAIVVDSYNRIDYSYLTSLGIQISEEMLNSNGTLNFDDIIGSKVKWVPNDAYYDSEIGENGNTIFTLTTKNAEKLYNSDDVLELTIVGVLRRVSLVGDTSNMASSFMSIMDEYMTSTSIMYTQALEDYVLKSMQESQIAKALLSQAKTGNYYDITTGSVVNKDKLQFSAKDNLTQCKMYGAVDIPGSIYIYPVSFETKGEITDYLQAWNDAQPTENTHIYWTDMESFISYINNTIDIVSIVLTVFAGISLVVSSVMIGVITYVSVVERTKEIGILRSLGARKRDIANVFNAETIIIGFFAGMIGVIMSALLTIPINAIINYFARISIGSIASLNPITAAILVVISMTLTLIAGLLPSSIASRRDPVRALRTE